MHAGDGIEHGDRAIEHAERSLHLGREIHVTGRVDNVHPHLDAFVNLEDIRLGLLHPSAGRRGGSDRDAALAFLLHPIGHGRAFVHFTDLVDHAGVKKNALGQRRLARVNVSGNADVARPLERIFPVRRIRIRRGGGFLFERGGHDRKSVTSGNGRRHDWLAPFCGCRHAS